MTTPTRYTARTPDDLLALVPVVLGFVPRQSVVMMTFAGAPRQPSDPAPRPFHARVDLPPAGRPQELEQVVAALLQPVRQHGLPRVVFVLYTEDASVAARTTQLLCRRFTRAGIEVLDVLRADGRCWFPLLPGRPAMTYDGIPYDVSAHPFRARSVLDGQVTHGSREELAATLAPGRVVSSAPLMAALAGIERLGEPGQLAAEGAWLQATLLRHIDRHLDRQPVRQPDLQPRPDDREAARILAAVREIELRDIAWGLITREDAVAHVELWRDLLRRAPEALVAAPAALLAFAAWLAGNGALAWCAVDRCVEVEPDYVLADYVASALTHAISPSSWEPPDRDEPASFDPA
ncbi:DUF4192 domain-containing protein [Nocardioides pacificus]